MIKRRTLLARSLGLMTATPLSSVLVAENAVKPAPVDGEGHTQMITIDAPSGPVQGVSTADCHIFKGIPFAAPPVGPLRFRAPVPLPPARAVRKALAFGPAPMQAVQHLPGTSVRMIGDAICSEDCLYLNVWAPASPGPHPVFVWIYGGGNVSGASSATIYDGATFARDGVVCVTFGYRLGAFGFLELGRLLGDSWRGSGNNALRDQVMALTWVKENIAAFGGDPARVTLGGESAGAKNVSAQLANPASRGLFHAAIVESGSGQTVHFPAQAEAVTALFISMFERQGGSPRALLTAPADSLLAAQNDTVAAYSHAFAFRSIVDQISLMRRPLDAVAAGESRNVRLLIGSNHDESLLFFPPGLIEQHKQAPDRQQSRREPVVLSARSD